MGLVLGAWGAVLSTWNLYRAAALRIAVGAQRARPHEVEEDEFFLLSVHNKGRPVSFEGVNLAVYAHDGTELDAMRLDNFGICGEYEHDQIRVCRLPIRNEYRGYTRLVFDATTSRGNEIRKTAWFYI